MSCLRCHEQNLRDYPVCVSCEPFAHFAYQALCRCDDPTCAEKRLKAMQFTERDHERAAATGLVVGRKETVIDYRTLKARKEALGLRIADIQDQCGFSDITISKVLNGSEDHKIETYKQIAEALGLEVVLTFRPKPVASAKAA